MKFEIKGKLLTCIGISLMIVALDVILVNVCVNRIVQPVKVSIARHSIHAKETIKKEDIEEISVSRKYLLGGICIDSNDVIGKKCRKDCFIPAGSLFYQEMLE